MIVRTVRLANSLRMLCAGTEKIDDGIAVAKEVGIERISEECPRFRRWLEWINGLAEDPAK